MTIDSGGPNLTRPRQENPYLITAPASGVTEVTGDPKSPRFIGTEGGTTTTKAAP